MHNIMERIPQFQELNQQLENIKREVVKSSGIDYHSQDARLVALDSMQMNLAATAMWMNGFNLLENFCTVDSVSNTKHFLNSVGSGLEFSETKTEMFKVLRLGVITLIHFKIENLFQNLCLHLKLLSKKRCGFQCLTELIYRACQISDRESRGSLIVLTHIRNTLHNNGIHRHPSLDIEVGQFQYQFIENEIINCTSWEAIMNLLHFNVAALGEVLLSEKITKIQGSVIDQFAAQFE